MFLHLLGYFKKYLTKSDKLDFFEELEKYNANSIQISALKRIIMNWLNEFNQEYLKGQSFFQPFPHELNFSFDSKVENRIV